MGQTVTLGGDRVGSGKRNKVYLHNYERSTHDLSYDWLSTMGCGMLIPFMCELVTRDDKYEIDLEAGLRTIPTKGPLFGSFKLQLDVYQCPLRLYQALLHNNPLAIGLKANQVKFPKMRLYGTTDENEAKEHVSATNSLVRYLGIGGIGTTIATPQEGSIDIYRDMFASGVLAYYDIFKNYYANKQEDNAYTLYNGEVNTQLFNTWQFIEAKYWDGTTQKEIKDTENVILYKDNEWIKLYKEENDSQIVFTGTSNTYTIKFQLEQNEYGKYLTKEEIENITIKLKYDPYHGYITGKIKDLQSGKNEYNRTFCYLNYNNNGKVEIQFFTRYLPNAEQTEGVLIEIYIPQKLYIKQEEVLLFSFELKNIDEMRYDILSFHQLGQSYILDDNSYEGIPYPYYEAIGGPDDQKWKKPLQGICVKTYQSDLFNNWLNTELIDGENGIAEITAISTASGSITIDQLQFSEKLYNLLNRIAVSGNTYQDYLDAAYTESNKRFEESPIWVGGMSDEIIFEEIVQTAPAEGTELGTLGGRGNLLGRKKGGKITVKIDEPSLLIGIVSITPRIVYTQGNSWINTEIDSLADIHVPALDAIGFQNLMAEQMDARANIFDENGEMAERAIVGKVPAWINYMTNYDKAYGDFANTEGDGYMVLNRNYETVNGELQDATTYIDPAKYNYAFAYTKRDAQNFWVKIKCDIKARRLMSAKQIPNV